MDGAIEGVRYDLDNQRLSGLHFYILVVCAFGFSFDLAEIAFGGVLSAIFSAPPHQISQGALSMLLAAVYVGAIVGATLLGYLADRFGRQRVLFWVLILLAITSVGAALSPNIETLIAFRALSGLALGAYPPLMVAFMTDIFPARQRGKLFFAASAIGYLGPPAIILLVRLIGEATPWGLEAWRWAFITCAAGAGICAALFLTVPESPRWLAARGRIDEARAVLSRFNASAIGAGVHVPSAASSPPTTGPMSPALFRQRLTFLVVAYFLTPWATVGFTVLSGAVLVQKGINPQDSILFVGLSSLGPLIGALLAGQVVDRLGRRPMLVLLATLLGTAGMIFAVSMEPVWLIGSGLAFNLLVNIFFAVVVLYATELFTTERRAQGTSWGWAANRVGSAIVPIVLLPLLQTQGPVAMFGVIALSLAAFIALIIAKGPAGLAGQTAA